MSPYEANRVLPPARAFGMALLAYLLFTAGDSMGKWLQADYSAAQILTIINFVGFCIVLGIASWMRGPRQVFKSTKWRQHIFRSSLMAISTMLVLFALKNLPLSDFYGIVFLNPIWVAIISLVFLKQKIPAARWAAIFVGFIGVLIIAGPRFAEMNMGAAAAILASLCSAGAALMARHIGGHEPTTNFSLATHHNTSFSRCICVCNIFLVKCYASSRKVWSFNKLHQIFGRSIFVLYQMFSRLQHFC